MNVSRKVTGEEKIKKKKKYLRTVRYSCSCVIMCTYIKILKFIELIPSPINKRPDIRSVNVGTILKVTFNRSRGGVVVKSRVFKGRNSATKRGVLTESP